MYIKTGTRRSRGILEQWSVDIERDKKGVATGSPVAFRTRQDRRRDKTGTGIATAYLSLSEHDG
ncbi:hypothetical protein Taro_027156 [Colocasia esculenta]|uniref:Uncharacterized protein n=1 Tax=Colocasia esculenta TaxID=4460 RepID=A0A843VD86_COLES|nr:hypothetical protein [Colocasia esculenta]